MSSELRDGLGVPVQVDERPGHLWFPALHAFNAEDVLCIAAISHDQSQGVWPAAAYLSRNGGRNWRWVPSISHYSLASVRLGPHELLLLPYELAPLPRPDQWIATAVATKAVFGVGGLLTTTFHTIQFNNLPREVARYPHGGLRLVTGGNVVPLADGTLFTTLYGRFVGEESYALLGVVSHDNGYTWSYRAEIANGQSLPHSTEGPSESCNVRLADGVLACLFRVGSGAGHDYQQSDSRDDGHHWSTPHTLVGLGSVKPQCIRLADDTLLLAGGRPGITLSRSKADAWQTYDLMAHHNSKVRRPDQRFKIPNPTAAVTSGYTSLCALDEGKALLCYDRLGNGWRGSPGPHGATDSVYCLPITFAEPPCT